MRSANFAFTRAKIQDVISTSISATSIPMLGESTIAIAVLVTPAQTIAGMPAFAVPAPISPPMRAWLLLDGIPSSQVMTFQLIAPISAPKITAGSMMPGSTMPFPTVSATCSPKNKKAMKLKKAAQATATCGRSTRVETTVAIELAASWSPFRKSNSKATPISAARSGKARVGSMIRRGRSRCLVSHLQRPRTDRAPARDGGKPPAR